VERDRSQSNDDARYVRVYDVRDGDGQAGAGRASQPLSLNGVTTRLVETGEILTVDGVITRLLVTGLPGGGWLEFEMDSGGERSQWSRMASGSVEDGTLAARLRLYEVGRAVRLRYTVVRPDPPIAGKQTVKRILAIWLEVDARHATRAADAP
jgi:hypothetical protein